MKGDRVTGLVEKEHHRLAFEQYYALGPKRSYRRASEKLGVSPSSLKLWGKSFGWPERIQERDADSARQMADRSLQAGMEEQARNRKIVHMALMKLAKAIADGTVRMQLGDLDRLIRLEAYLSGNNDDPLGWVDRESDPEKLRARLKEISAGAEAPIVPPATEEPSDD